jgi:hypothetical protein
MQARPTLVRDAVRAWPAAGTWTPAYLARVAPEWRVPVTRLDGLHVAFDRERGLRRTRRPLGELVALLEGGDGYVMAPLDELPAALRGDVGEPELCAGASWRSSKLWISPRGAVTPLHFDVAHNLHAVLHGRKRFVLFARSDFRALYPEPIWSGVPNFSRVDLSRVDEARFPRFRRARPIVITVEAGDAIVIPGGVWHHVTSEREAVSVSFWWARGAHALVARAADWWKRVRGLST